MSAAAELALDKDGHFLAVRLDGYGNMGAYLGVGRAAARHAQYRQEHDRRLPHPADRSIDQVRVHQHVRRCRPIAAPAGPEGNYFMERLIDKAAREMGIDRLELRRRNHITPTEIPYRRVVRA